MLNFIMCIFYCIYDLIKTYLTLVIGSEEIGVHELLFNSIRKSDLDLRKTLYQNIVLSGGSTLFKGKIKIGEKTCHSIQAIIVELRPVYKVLKNLLNKF